MGRLVQLWKHRETASEVEYLYGPSREKAGLLAVSKAGEGARKVRGVEGLSSQEDDFLFFQLASVKVGMLRERGDFPGEAYIAT